MGTEPDPIVLASVYRLTAVNFRLAAQAVSSTLELRSDGRPAKVTGIPFYFLASHAAELFLKSALLKRGMGSGELKQFDYRHNLRGLIDAVRDKGVRITSETLDMIDGLHSQHHTHALRYTSLLDDGQATFMPPPPLVFAMLDELLMLTRISTQGV